MSQTYDLKAIFDDEIRPALNEIIEICEREQIPMFAIFAITHQNVAFVESQFADPRTGCAVDMVVAVRKAVETERASRKIIEEASP